MERDNVTSTNEISKPPNVTSEDRGKEIKNWINKVNFSFKYSFFFFSF